CAAGRTTSCRRTGSGPTGSLIPAWCETCGSATCRTPSKMPPVCGISSCCAPGRSAGCNADPADRTMTRYARPTSQNKVSPFKPARPRLLYLVSEDWYFLSHRLPMARAARDAGYEVHVATRIDGGGAAIAAEGFTTHPLTWRRGSTNPLDVSKAIVEVRNVYRTLR